jgi:hypothetical protein
MQDDDRRALRAFIDQLVQLREDAGKPSLFKLCRLSEQARAAGRPGRRVLIKSTTSEILNHKRKGWPEWEWVASFVLACLAAAEHAPGMDTEHLGDLVEWRARYQAARVSRRSDGTALGEREKRSQHSVDATMQRYSSYFGRTGGRLVRHARAGDTTAAYELGVLLCCAGRAEEARTWLLQAADGHHNEAYELYHAPTQEQAAADAAYHLACSYQDADNIHLASLFYKHAADAGHSNAVIRLILVRARQDRLRQQVNAHPALREAVLGAQLRRIREASGITREAAGHLLRLSASKIGGMEGGRVDLKERDVADLLTLYGVCDDVDRAALLWTLDEADPPGWWREFGDGSASGFEAYMRLEQAATIIRTYEVQSVPSLLQTADYARAVIRLSHPDIPESQLERRVSLRMRRQQILRQPDSPRLWAVIDEAALRRQIVSTATMRHQLKHLLQIAELPHITIQLASSRAGGNATRGGPITILRFLELPDVVYLEQPSGVLYPDEPADIDHYTKVMDRLCLHAKQPDATAAIIHRVLK